MDKELRKEFRAWKAEAEDRISRLEAALAEKSASAPDPAPTTTSSKKNAADAASEKDSV